MAQPSAHDPKAYVANATPKIQEFLKRYQKPGTITTTVESNIKETSMKERSVLTSSDAGPCHSSMTKASLDVKPNDKSNIKHGVKTSPDILASKYRGPDLQLDPKAMPAPRAPTLAQKDSRDKSAAATYIPPHLRPVVAQTVEPVPAVKTQAKAPIAKALQDNSAVRNSVPPHLRPVAKQAAEPISKERKSEHYIKASKPATEKNKFPSTNIVSKADETANNKVIEQSSKTKKTVQQTKGPLPDATAVDKIREPIVNKAAAMVNAKLNDKFARPLNRVTPKFPPAACDLAVLESLADFIAEPSPEKVAQKVAVTLIEPKPEIFRNYDVPKLGDPLMPITELNPAPEETTWSLQIEARLPEKMRDLPPPVYHFSKAKVAERRRAEEARLRETERARLPQDEAQVQLIGQAAVIEASQALQHSGTRSPSQVCRSETRSESMRNLPAIGVLRSSRAVVETVENVSRWRWFLRNSHSTNESEDTSISELKLQLAAEWDQDFADTCGSYEVSNPDALALLDARTMSRINDWLVFRVRNALERPFIVDITNTDFISGVLPISGLKYEYQEFPPDYAWEETRIDYGPIDHDLVQTHRPNDKYSLEEGRLERRAQYFCDRAQDRATKEEKMRIKAKMVNERKRAELEKRAQLQKRTRNKRNSGTEDVPAFIQYPDPTKACPVKEIRSLSFELVARVDNPWTPKVNIYIRQARRSDFDQILTIFNHYVDTIHVPDTHALTRQSLEDRFREAENAQLPFFVAVLKSSNNRNVEHRAKRGVRRQQNYATPIFSTSEVILGFCGCAPWGFDNCFKFVTELYVYVDPNHTRQGIAKNLLDRIMCCMDGTLSGTCHRGCDFMPNREQKGQWFMAYVGNMRRLVINLYYYDEEDLEGRKKFLEDEFRFVAVGNHVNICEKENEKQYSMMIMEYICREDLFAYEQRTGIRPPCWWEEGEELLKKRASAESGSMKAIEGPSKAIEGLNINTAGNGGKAKKS